MYNQSASFLQLCFFLTKTQEFMTPWSSDLKVNLKRPPLKTIQIVGCEPAKLQIVLCVCVCQFCVLRGPWWRPEAKTHWSNNHKIVPDTAGPAWGFTSLDLFILVRILKVGEAVPGTPCSAAPLCRYRHKAPAYIWECLSLCLDTNEMSNCGRHFKKLPSFWCRCEGGAILLYSKDACQDGTTHRHTHTSSSTRLCEVGKQERPQLSLRHV